MQLNISASNYLGRNFACAGHGGTPSVVLAASMLGSPPPSTQRCCLTTEVSLSRTQGDPRAKNLEISRCRRRVPASGVTPGGIRECTSSGSGQATWQWPARPPCAATARHSHAPAISPISNFARSRESCPHPVPPRASRRKSWCRHNGKRCGLSE